MKETPKKYFGYEDFKPLQKEIIRDVLDKRNVVVLMPTGLNSKWKGDIPFLHHPGTSRMQQSDQFY
jgi:ATP-dependent DNA helicase RecQ